MELPSGAAVRRLVGRSGVRARLQLLGGRRQVERALVEGALFGGLLVSMIVGVLVNLGAVDEAQRLGEEVGPEVLVGLLLGAAVGFFPGALLGMLLVACVLLFVITSLLVGDGPIRWWVIGSVLLALAVIVSVLLFGQDAAAWSIVGLIWIIATTSFLRMRAVARGPEGVGVDEATAPRLDRAFGALATSEPPSTR